MGITKRLYMEFLDRVGIDPEDDNGIARFAHEQDLNKAFHEFTGSKAVVSIKRHKTDKIANIEQREGDWS